MISPLLALLAITALGVWACCCSACSNCPDDGVIPPIIHITLTDFANPFFGTALNGTYPLYQGDFGSGPYVWQFLGLMAGGPFTVRIVLMCPDAIPGSPPGSPWWLGITVTAGGGTSLIGCEQTEFNSCNPPDIRFSNFHFEGSATIISGNAVVSA